MILDLIPCNSSSTISRETTPHIRSMISKFYLFKNIKFLNYSCINLIYKKLLNLKKYSLELNYFSEIKVDGGGGGVEN